MYRIIFDTKRALWAIQLSSLFGLRWRNVSGKAFETLDEAEAYVDQVGLSQAYARQDTSPPPWAQPQVQHPHIQSVGYQPPAVVRVARRAV